MNYSPFADRPFKELLRLQFSLPFIGIRFELNRARAIVTNYGDERLKTFSEKRGVWPFLGVRIAWFDIYIGWKPINLNDPKFEVPSGYDRNTDAVELSVRLSDGT